LVFEINPNENTSHFIVPPQTRNARGKSGVPLSELK